MNPNSWEDLRLFYLRKLLKPEIISQSDKGSRANYYAVFNMVYVDSILPRDGHNTKSLSSIWTERYIF